jgi:hypothetical protein
MSFLVTLAILVLSLTVIFYFALGQLFKHPLQIRVSQSSNFGKRYFIHIMTAHKILLVVFVVISIITTLYAERPLYYFGLEALLFTTGVFAIQYGERKNRRGLLLVTIIAVLLSNIATVTFGNLAIPTNIDEYRDTLAANSIVSGSNYIDVQLLMSRFNGYYAAIPALPTSLSLLSMVAGTQPYLIYPMLGIALSLAFVVGTFLAISRFAKDQLIAWIAAFVLLSTPRLSFIPVIPETVSMAIMAVASLVFFIRLSKRRLQIADLKYFGILIFLFATSIIYHPNGAVTLILLLVSTITLTILVRTFRFNYELRILAAICVIFAIAYWVYNDQALSTLTMNSVRLVETFFAEFGSNSYVAPNLSSGNEIFAFSWALPFSLSSAFILVFLTKLRKREYRHIVVDDKILISLGAACVAVPLTSIGFMSFLFAPNAAIERYISVSTFFLMLIPTSVGAGLLLRSLKTKYAYPLLGIIIFSVAVGSYSPEFAPLEHKSFESFRPTADANAELSGFERYVPDHSYMYIDNDIPPFGQLVSSETHIDYPISGQTTRNVLNDFGSGELDLFSAIQGKVTFFIIKSDRITNSTSYDDINLIGSSGDHKTFVIERK